MSIEGTGQIADDLSGFLLVLHEDQVPDLDEAVAVLVGGSRRAAGDAGAVVVEDLRARTARPIVAHGPEVVGRADADDPLLRQAGDLAPQRRGLGVVGVDRHAKPLRIETHLLGDQPPRQLDRAVLKIGLGVRARPHRRIVLRRPEREVAEHLEKGQVPRGVAHIVEVVVLAPGANALLRRRRARRGRRLGAGEDVLERHHAGVDEQQGRDRSGAPAARTGSPRDRWTRNSPGTASGCRRGTAWPRSSRWGRNAEVKGL